jgi:integrase
MATIRKIRSNYFAYFYERTRSPKRKSWPLRTSRQDVARRRVTELEDAYESGDFDPWRGGWQYEDVTLDTAIERYLAHKREEVRESTLEQYRLLLRAWEREHAATGQMLRDITPQHLRPFVQDPSVSSATRKNRHAYLDSFLRWALDSDLIDENPLDDVKRPKVEQKTPAFFRPPEIERLITYIEHFDETTVNAAGVQSDHQWLIDIIRVAVATGLRRSELTGLRWQDVDLNGRRLYVRSRDGAMTKSGDERVVPLSGSALSTLERMDSEREDALDGPVFTSKGTPVHPGTLTNRFKRMCREAKVRDAERLSFHSLRHSAASWMAMEGVPLRVIQQILGHSSITQTEQYSHLVPELLHRAMEQTFGTR